MYKSAVWLHKFNFQLKCQVYSLHSVVSKHSAILQLGMSCMITHSDETTMNV